MVVTPTAIPATMPVDDPTVAVGLLALLHVPPAGVAFRVTVLPVQTDDRPVMETSTNFATNPSNEPP